MNLHVFFFLGPLMVFVAMVHRLLQGHRYEDHGRLFFALCGMCLLNPYGLSGALVPLTIFREYGYQLVENQSIWFLQQRFGGLHYLYVELLSFILLIGIAFLVKKKGFRPLFYVGVVFVMFFSLSWMVMRAIPLYALLMMPILSAGMALLGESRVVRWNRVWKVGCVGMVMLGVLGMVGLKGTLLSPFRAYSGLGLVQGSQDAATFLKAAPLHGRIFNNYDIGGYLIFHLYEDQSVFVDNRPEAYSPVFFRRRFIPMQENESVWQTAVKEYGLDWIVFDRRDLTPWGQPFLIRRIKDPEWVPVYVDAFVLVLVKRKKAYSSFIQVFEIPQEVFRVSSSSF